MGFCLTKYNPPDFSQAFLRSAPDARMLPAPMDGVVPDGYHATTIFPEYFKIGGEWMLAGERAAWTASRSAGAGASTCSSSGTCAGATR